MIAAPRHVSPPARAPRAVLLGVALWLGLGGPAWVASAAQCLRHGGHHGQSHAPIVMGPSADCDHCPIRSCGTTAVCSATPVTGLIAYPPVVPWAPLHRVAEFRLAAPADSTTYQPPTPHLKRSRSRRRGPRAGGSASDYRIAYAEYCRGRLAAGALASAPSALGQTDYRNLDEGRPSRPKMRIRSNGSGSSCFCRTASRRNAAGPTFM